MKKRFLSMLLAIVMVVGLVPGMTLTASAEDGNEAVWGTSADDLGGTGREGTLAQAVAAAKDNNDVKYIKMIRDVIITPENGFDIRGGNFTLDMGGYEMSWGRYQLYISGGKVVFKNGTFSSTHNYGIKVDGDMEDTEITFESGTYSAYGSVIYVAEGMQLTVMENVSMRADIPVYIGSGCAASLIDGADLSGTSADIAIRGGANVVTEGIYDFDVDGDGWSLDLSNSPDCTGTTFYNFWGDPIFIQCITMSDRYGLFDLWGRQHTDPVDWNTPYQNKLTVRKLHEHEWQYTANGSAITADCIDNTCDEDGGSVTILAPTGTLVYDGETDFKATLTGEFTTGLDLDVTDITYEYSETEDGEYTTAVDCTKAGYYKASISVENNVTATVSYRVTKAERNAPEAPQLESKTTRSITVKEVEGCEYSIDGENWQASTEFTNLTPATEYTIYIRYAGDENHEPSLEKFEVFTTDNLVLDRIEITTQPKLDYTASDTLDLSGMVVTAYYTDGSSALLAYTDVTTSIANGTMLTVSENGAVITVTYNGKTAQIAAITVQQKQSGFDYDMWYWTLMMLYNQQFDITATATDGGVITPAGVSKVKYSNDLTYTIMPDDGYVIADVIVDGESIGAVSVYKFDNVRKDHEIIAIFAEIPWENPYADVSAKDWFYEDVQFVDENGLMNGTVENEIFAPELTATRAMIVTILWRLEGKPVVDSPVDFFDVPENEWYTDAINWASANGIVLGYEDGMFYPDKSITREQLAAILHRYAAYKGVDNRVIFPMIPHYDYSEWAENDVIWADMNGMLDGIGSDMTDMTADASRAEVAAMLRRFCERFSAE